MNAEMLSNTVDVEMICDHVKYSLTVSRASPHTYALFMNDSCLEVDLHRYNISIIYCSSAHIRRRYVIFVHCYCIGYVTVVYYYHWMAPVTLLT